jgi:hypothetical protein
MAARRAQDHRSSGANRHAGSNRGAGRAGQLLRAALLLLWTAVAARFSMRTVALGALVTAAVAARIVFEERLLRETFTEYADYARATRALIPFVL